MADDKIIYLRPDDGNNVVPLRAAHRGDRRLPTLRDQNDAWNAYVAARSKADKTLKLEDGIASAYAYTQFLALFDVPDSDGAA